MFDSPRLTQIHETARTSYYDVCTDLEQQTNFVRSAADLVFGVSSNKNLDELDDDTVCCMMGQICEAADRMGALITEMRELTQSADKR